MESIQDATQKLMAIDPHCLASGSADFSCIETTSQVIIRALDVLKSNHEAIASTAAPATGIVRILGDVQCLTKLFEFRKVFHALAINSEGFDENAIVVCWVDVIFARMADVVLLILQDGCNKNNSESSLLRTIEKHRDEASLHAAAQLPHSWEDTVEMLSSEYVSPAATRLIVRLLYAVYVLSPAHGGSSPWPQEGPAPASVLRVLQTYVHRCHDGPLDPIDRPSHAMIVSVYAAAASSQDDSQSSPLRPYTQAILLTLMQRSCMPEGGKYSMLIPPERLDASHNAIITYGRTLQWLWYTWNDDRTNGYETVLYLTAAWLYNIRRTSDAELGSQAWEGRLLSAISEQPQAASLAFSNLLLRAKMFCLSQPPSSSTIDTIHKACVAVVWLMKASQAMNDSWTVLYGYNLCNLYILLPNTPASSEAKNVILEGITYIEPELLQKIFKELRQDAKIDLRGRLDEELRRLTKIVIHGDHCSQDCHALRQMIQLLSSLWAANIDTTRFILKPSVNGFINAILQDLSPDYPSKSCLIHLQSLWTLLAIIKRRKHLNPDFDGVECFWEDELIYSFALDTCGEDLWSSLAFASYVIATASAQRCDAILYATCWDLFQNILLRETRSPNASDPGSLLSSAVVLGAMKAILTKPDEAVADYVRSSPWTLTLIGELEALSCNAILTSLAKSLRTEISKVLRRSKTQTSQASKTTSRGGLSDRLVLELYCWRVGSRLYLLPLDLEL